jgi:hypothetical protein
MILQAPNFCFLCSLSAFILKILPLPNPSKKAELFPLRIRSRRRWGLRWVTIGGGLLCEETTGVGSVLFEIFRYGLLCDLGFVVGFVLEIGVIS